MFFFLFLTARKELLFLNFVITHRKLQRPHFAVVIKYRVIINYIARFITICLYKPNDKTYSASL